MMFLQWQVAISLKWFHTMADSTWSQNTNHYAALRSPMLAPVLSCVA